MATMLKAVLLIGALASVALAQVPPYRKVNGYVPPKTYGKHNLPLENIPKASVAKQVQPKVESKMDGFMHKKSEPRFLAEGQISMPMKARQDEDNCYPPIQEEWRCLEDPKAEFPHHEYHSLVPKARLDPDNCPMINSTWCTKPESDYYPIPCNCHAYFRCVELKPGLLLPCIYWCNPCDLVFDPQTRNCVYEPEAPPGTCFDTPPPISTTTTPETSTSTTTTPTTTTTTPTTTTKPGPPVPCDHVGQTFPFPGNCHLYYLCYLDADGDFDVHIFSCGDEWAYDPHQGSCSWPEHAEEICP